jgi:dTDP-glucose 4,6-dehydratase
MKSILITGGLGFIGSNFVKHIFKKYDYKIFNVDVKTYAANYKNISEEINQSGRYYLSLYDINSTKDVKRLVQKNQINYIVNFAAESHVDNSINDSKPFHFHKHQWNTFITDITT